jgi:hypothetical protein
MFRALSGSSKRSFERELLRRSVGMLAAERPCCASCGRTPLTGERVHLYDRDRVVCELCRPAQRGEPERSEVVHHAERGQTVRVRVTRAAA